MYNKVLIISTVIAVICFAQIIFIEFNIAYSFYTLECARIIINLSYAFVSSWFFFLLIVYLPKRWNEYHRKKVVVRRIFHINNCIKSIIQEVMKDAQNNEPITKDSLFQSLNYIDDKIKDDYQKFMIKHIRKIINELYLFCEYIDPKALTYLDRIDFRLIGIDFGTRIVNKTLGQSLCEPLWEVKELCERLKDKYRKEYETIEKEIMKQ